MFASLGCLTNRQMCFNFLEQGIQRVLMRRCPCCDFLWQGRIPVVAFQRVKKVGMSGQKGVE